MTENPRSDDSLGDSLDGWLDAAAAERLLRCRPAGPRIGPEARRAQRLLLLLAAAATPAPLDAAREDAAMAAFRASRAAAARSRRSVGPARAAIGALLAAVTLGGVAAAATGVIPSPFTGSGLGSTPPSGAPGTGQPGSGSWMPGSIPSTGTGPGSGGSTTPGRPGTATGPGGGGARSGSAPAGSDRGDQQTAEQQEEARRKQLIDAVEPCRTWEKAHGNARKMNAETYQGLVEAAGGENKVAAFCAAALSKDGSAGGDAASGTGTGPTATATATATATGRASARPTQDARPPSSDPPPSSTRPTSTGRAQ